MTETVGWISSFAGTRIIESANCYITKIVVYGIADKRRPNNKKPLYRRKTIRIPTAYKVGDTLVCHPEYMRAIRQKMMESMKTRINNTALGMFGLSKALQETTLTIDKLNEVIRQAGL